MDFSTGLRLFTEITEVRLRDAGWYSDGILRSREKIGTRVSKVFFSTDETPLRMIALDTKGVFDAAASAEITFQSGPIKNNLNRSLDFMTNDIVAGLTDFFTLASCQNMAIAKYSSDTSSAGIWSPDELESVYQLKHNDGQWSWQELPLSQVAIPKPNFFGTSKAP